MSSRGVNKRKLILFAFTSSERRASILGSPERHGPQIIICIDPHGDIALAIGWENALLAHKENGGQ
jgi:hypothetical protein